jgi:hypothetical protein
MEHTGTSIPSSHAISYASGLPANRVNWPEDARLAYREVLRELDGWSRQHNSSATSNSWVAEEAIRQTW